MLPSIIDIATENGLEVNPRSLNNKEVLYKCPFCLEDANKPHKYYLSLNPRYNVFKCWYCGVKGGVLVFESMVTEQPYQDIKSKYFKPKKNYHPADILTYQQLEKINWDEIKRKDHQEYKRSLDQVIREWEDFVYREKVLAFAKLLVGIKTFCYELAIDSISFQSEKSSIPSLVKDVCTMYSSETWDKWALEGRKHARKAVKAAERANDKNALAYLLFSFYMSGEREENRSSNLKIPNRRVG